MVSSESTLLLGAVAYDPKVVTIWEGFQRYFADHGLDFDFVLYSNYERLVESLLAGHLHVAWNSPLAWLEAEQASKARGLGVSAIAMRDTDQELTSVVLVREDSAIRSVSDLEGKTVAVGAADSPQATLIPLLHLAEQGLEPDRDFEVKRHDVLVGKHGDHIGGERDAVRALISGKADAACIIDANHLLFSREGTLPRGAARVLLQTQPYDHCNFTVLRDAPEEPVSRFRELLFEMSYDDPDVRPLMDLEGLKAWRPGRLFGYAQLQRAVTRFGYPDGWPPRLDSALSSKHSR